MSRGIGRITTCSLFSKSHLSFARLTRFPYSSIFPSATGVGRFARMSGRWAVALASNPTGVAFLFLKHFRALVSPLLPFSPDCRADMEIAPSKAFQQSNTVNKLRDGMCAPDDLSKPDVATAREVAGQMREALRRMRDSMPNRAYDAAQKRAVGFDSVSETVSRRRRNQ